MFRNPGIDASSGTKSGEGSSPKAAELLDKLGVKSWVLGGVRFSEMHANWIVKTEEEARAEDVRALIERAQAEVHLRADTRARAHRRQLLQAANQQKAAKERKRKALVIQL